MEWSTLRRLTPTVNGWLLFGAVLSGALALWASRHYLQERESVLREETSRGLDTRPVIVAAHELRTGTVLAAGDLAVRQVPRRFAVSDSLAPEAATRLLGRRVAHGRRGGDMVVVNDLEALRSASLAARVPEGLRALTISVDELGAFAGRLQAGDRVDLYYLPQAGGDASRIGLLLSSVLVMATGSDAPVEGPTDAPQAGAPAEFSTITLQLAPDDAARVALAQRAGQLTAVLRARNDESLSAPPVKYAKDLLARPTGARAVRGPERMSIELIVGGHGSTVAEAGQMSVGAGHE